MFLLVWIEGCREVVNIEPTLNLNLADNLSLKCGDLIRQQISKLNFHTLFLLLPFSQDGCVTTSYRI